MVVGSARMSHAKDDKETWAEVDIEDEYLPYIRDLYQIDPSLPLPTKKSREGKGALVRCFGIKRS